MFRRYSPSATDPAPSVPPSMASSSARSQPGFTRARTRYRMVTYILTGIVMPRDGLGRGRSARLQRLAGGGEIGVQSNHATQVFHLMLFLDVGVGAGNAHLSACLLHHAREDNEHANPRT